MTRKRGNNEGSIHRRESGTWRAQVTLEGRRLSHTANTRRECQDWIRETLGQIDYGLTFASTQITFEDYLENWLSSKKASIKHTTWIHYSHLAHIYIIPSIGKFKIRDLNPNRIQSLYNRLIAEEIGIHTVRKIHTVMHSALAHAVKTGLISRNPASATIPPSIPPKEMKFFDESQIIQMLVTAKGHRWEALYHLAVTTGMRQMEILGLKWTDLDLTKQTIKVKRQLVRPDGKAIKFTSPKTKFGRRNIDIGSKAVMILRGHHERQLSERNTAGEKWEEHDLVFTICTGGPIHPRNLLRNFKKLLQDAGLPEIRFHDLRHTAASLMLNHGIPLIIVSRRLGHVRPSITLDVYGHLIPTMHSEVAQLMEDLITPIELRQVSPGCTGLHQESTILTKHNS